MNKFYWDFVNQTNSMPVPPGNYRVTMTVGDETKTLGAGDVVVVNRGVEHELHSEGGMTFVEALAPGGYLVVGTSERVADARGLGLTSPHHFIYRKS